MSKQSIPINEKKVIRICVRFNEAELKAIDKHRSKSRRKMRISTFLRQIALDAVNTDTAKVTAK